MFRPILAVCALATAAACGAGRDAPTDSGSEPTSLAVGVLLGDGQQAFPGDALDRPVTVQVTDANGRPFAGSRRIRFSVQSGGGSLSDSIVVSGADGSASVTWRLGTTVGTQRLEAAIADGSPGKSTTVSATCVSRDAADLVVIRGAESGTFGILARQDDAVTVREELTWPDTMLRLLPRGPAGAWQEVTVFTTGHPPTTVIQPWTDGVDTVRLALRAPISVPFTAWITHDFEATAARAQYDIGNVDEIWRRHMTGLQVGSVRIVNAPELAGPTYTCANAPTVGDGGAINVYYVSSNIPDGTAFRPAFTCSENAILMGMNLFAYIPDYRYLLAHEVGHSFGLDHVFDATNLMTGIPNSPIGGLLWTGQIYQMHYRVDGVVGLVLGIHPPGQRDCRNRFFHCPDQTLTAW